MAVTNFGDMPLYYLQMPTVIALCEMLDTPKPKENDYKMLLEYLEISYSENERLMKEVRRDNSYTSITARLLCIWAKKPIEDSNVQNLKEFLVQIKRFDVLREINDLLDRDLERAISLPKDAIYPEDVEELWKNPKVEPCELDERLFSSDIFNPVKVHDAFISFNPRSKKDCDVMEEIYDHLSHKGVTVEGRKILFRVVVGARDLLTGGDLASSLIRAIRYRSKRVILIISESFKNSEECVFQMQVARGDDLAAYRRKAIPVLIESTTLPDEIFNLNFIDLTNPDRKRREFERLAASLL